MKTPCKVQCPQCPFRKTSIPAYLGDYTVSSVFKSIWHGQAFFCHTKINYGDDNWLNKAEKNGKLCLGGLAYAKKMLAPIREVSDPEVKKAREGYIEDGGVECMTPMEFMKWHDPNKTVENFAKLKQMNKK